MTWESERTGSCPSFVIPKSFGTSGEVRRRHEEMFPHLLKVQQPVGIRSVKRETRQQRAVERAHMIQVQTTSDVLRSPRVGKATIKL